MKVKKNRIKVITLGCSKNLVDSEFLMAQLKSNNVELVDDEKKCESVIINTCGFIDTAKEESINTILKAVERKEKGKLKNIYVAGCLSDRYKSELEKEIPEVNKYFGATDKHKTVVQILNEFGIDYKKELLGERLVTTPSHFAYIKISEGCDNPCSFCAIPIMRGAHKSKPLEEILMEAQKLASSGVKELIIIGQDTTYWGLDLNNKRGLAGVLDELSKINGIEWLRLMYAYPSRFPLDALNEIRDNEKVCKYLDIPVQHVSDNMLKSMRRGITKKNQIALLEKIRNEIPGIAIRTSVMVGYPGETEKDFEELLEFIKEFRFDRLGVFTYSHEEGTAAFKLKDDVPKKEKMLRQKLVLEAQKKIADENNSESVGKDFKVIIDRKEGEHFIGRSYKDAPEVDQEVFVTDNGKIKTGEFYNVRIFDSEEFDIFGEVIK
ncbi:MAG: 30S ribosomal protein S12 methylthiotransferase RimO [Ignavibacteriae bacterium]|nr:30S ribosomal protein S12 methylthiotransferase RimO [Ignavibacteriota bacterium]